LAFHILTNNNSLYRGELEDEIPKSLEEPIADDDEKNEDLLSKEQQAKYEAKRHKKLLSGTLEDAYEILGLEKLRWQATDEDIKQACKPSNSKKELIIICNR
jgi:hypothetical protein